MACGAAPNNIFAFNGRSNFLPTDSCANPDAQLSIAADPSTSGERGYWYATAPGGLLIDSATASSVAVNEMNASGSGYGGGYFWGPNNSHGVPVSPTDPATGPFSAAAGDAGFPSSTFGFQIVCDNPKTCSAAAIFSMSQVTLSVEETQGPSLSAGGLWDQSGWVRGSWPITVGGDSPSGVCSYSASISGDPVGASASYAANQTVWHQCASGGLSGTLNTTQAANGTDTLNVSDADAAGLTNGSSKQLRVDNVTPTVSLSGPSTALSTAGTQDVGVAVNTGPSGAYGADCSVDGGAVTFYAGSTSQVPVSGIGSHTVTCTGLSNAVSFSGARASSATASFDVDIQQPTAEAISFSDLRDALRCHKAAIRVKKLGKPRIMRLHGHKVSVRRVHYVKRHVRRCQARTVRRRVLVALKRRGRIVRRRGHIVRVRRIRRVVVLPHRVIRRVREIHHGRGTTVSGYLLGPGGVALAGQPVTILAAPNTGTGLVFTAASSAVTDADGFWVAKIPAGPSRILEASYAGTPTLAAASTTTVKLRVPAKLKILSHTRRVGWGYTVRFSGRVFGGHIPPGGINLQLRYGYGKAWTTYGVKTHVEGNGRFRTAFTFGPGDPRRFYRFHFRFDTLPGGNYPWASGASNRVDVTVGGHPHAKHRHGVARRHRRHKEKRHRRRG